MYEVCRVCRIYRVYRAYPVLIRVRGLSPGSLSSASHHKARHIVSRSPAEPLRINFNGGSAYQKQEA